MGRGSVGQVLRSTVRDDGRVDTRVLRARPRGLYDGRPSMCLRRPGRGGLLGPVGFRGRDLLHTDPRISCRMSLSVLESPPGRGSCPLCHYLYSSPRNRYFGRKETGRTERCPTGGDWNRTRPGRPRPPTGDHSVGVSSRRETDDPFGN